MPLSHSRQWSLFRAVRILVYTLATLASMGIAAIYAVIVIRWNSMGTTDDVSVNQRAIGISLFVIYAMSTITIYFIAILRFRVWSDTVCLAILAIAQFGGTASFHFGFSSPVPCDIDGTEICTLIENIAFFGGWSLAGLLLFFGLYVLYMHNVPISAPQLSPESVLAIQLRFDEKREIAEKRSSVKTMASASSVYSQQSHITPYTYVSPTDMYKPRRSPSIPESSRVPINGHYRAETPASIHSAGEQSSAVSLVDYDMSRTPLSARSAGTAAATLGSHTSKPAPTYGYENSRTPISLRSAATAATLGSHTHTKLVPTYEYAHSRTPGSTGSAESGASQGSHNARVPPFQHYRSVTPAASMRSVGLTSASSIRTVPRQRYYRSNGMPAPQPLMAAGRNHPLTQAFIAEPVSRMNTPMTTLSNTSFYMPMQHQQPMSAIGEVQPVLRHDTPMTTLSNTSFYMPLGQQPMFSPPGLSPVGPGYNFPQPPASNYSQSPRTPTNQLPNERSRSRSPLNPIANNVPVAMQLRQALLRTPSPNYSIRPDDTVRGSRKNTFSSVPRSPSPETVSFHNMPATPLSAVLPARPTLSPALYIDRYGIPDVERQRYGSSPDIIMNDAPIFSNQQYQATDGYRRDSPSRNRTAVQPDDRGGPISQWREYTPRPLEVRRS